MNTLIEYKAQTRTLKRETHALYLAGRDQRPSRPARAIIAIVIAYAVSPIDLIPDSSRFWVISTSSYCTARHRSN